MAVANPSPITRLRLPSELVVEIGLYLKLSDLTHLASSCKYIHSIIVSHKHFSAEQRLRRHYYTFGNHDARGNISKWENLAHYYTSISLRGDDRFEYVSKLHLDHMLDRSSPKITTPCDYNMALEIINSLPSLDQHPANANAVVSMFDAWFQGRRFMSIFFSLLIPCFTGLHTIVFPYTRTGFQLCEELKLIFESMIWRNRTTTSSSFPVADMPGFSRGIFLPNLRVLDWSNTAHAPLATMSLLMLLPSIRIVRASHARLPQKSKRSTLYSHFRCPMQMQVGRSHVARIDLFETQMTDEEIWHIADQMVEHSCIIKLCTTESKGHHEYKSLSIVSVQRPGPHAVCSLSRHYLKRRQVGMRDVAHHRTSMPKPQRSHEDITGRALVWDTEERKEWSMKFDNLDGGPWDEKESSCRTLGEGLAR